MNKLLDESEFVAGRIEIPTTLNRWWKFSPRVTLGVNVDADGEVVKVWVAGRNGLAAYASSKTLWRWFTMPGIGVVGDVVPILVRDVALRAVNDEIEQMERVVIAQARSQHMAEGLEAIQRAEEVALRKMRASRAYECLLEALALVDEDAARKESESDAYLERGFHEAYGVENNV